jgi:selenocysteine lyase/cysteine desulfurase
MINLVQDMMGVTLNKRGRIVIGTMLFIAFMALWAFLDNATTPEMCKVPTEQMNQFCLDLLYP